MSVFGIKCPGCGILLEADENDVGAKVECTGCGKTFILARDPDPSTVETTNDTVTFTFDTFQNDLESSFLRVATPSPPSGSREYEYDGQKKYLQSIYALSSLQWKETQRLLAEYRRDPENKSLWDKIISGNLYLVARTVLSIAKRNSLSDFEDLLTEGYLGLAHAVDKFDNLGTSEFGAYAGFWIMQYVKRYISNNLSAVRVPIQAQEKLNMQGNVDHDQDCSHVDFGLKLAHALVKQIDPYQTWVIREEECQLLYQVIVDEYGCEDPAYNNAFTRSFDVKLYWDNLDEREKMIVLARNGLYNDRLWTLDELSVCLGRTRERVRQLEQTSYDKLRKRLFADGYESSEDYTGGGVDAVETPMEFFIPTRYSTIDNADLRMPVKHPAHSVSQCNLNEKTLAKSFQATFPAAYQQLSEDHSNRDGIDTVLTVSCGDSPDVFKIAMDSPLIESKESDVPAQGETAAPIFSEASAQNDIHGVCIQENWIRFDFTNAPSFEGTVPAYCCIDGNVFEGRNWVRILVALVEFELAKGNPALEDLYEKPLYCKKAVRPFFMKRRIEGSRNCSELSNGYWINVGWTIPFLMRFIQAFLLHCGYDKQQIEIYGKPRANKENGSPGHGNLSAASEQPDIFQIAMDTPLVESNELDATAQAETAAPVSPETSTSETVSCSEDTTNDENQLAELLQAEFVNGVRPGSIIDQKKIRKLYQQYFDADLPEDFDFAAILPRVGIAHSGKVFPKPTSKQGGWRSLIDQLVSEGNTLFQFSRLVELHADELMKSGIGSGELLQKIMTRDASDSYDISGGFFAPRGLDAISCRIAAAIMPQEGAIIDILATSKQLPYVDTAYIRNWCKCLDNLVWIGQDVYAIAERIEFDDTEVARGRSCCETAIAAEGFFSLSQLSLDDSAAMNDLRMTDSALRRVFFQRFLSDDFEAHGQIVCAKGANIDGQIPLHAFLQEHSDVTLDQLEAVAKEYNIVLWQALKTAHEDMARVDRDRFVAPGMVPFDIAAIDSAIANVCEDVPMPLESFTNLSNFPAVPGWTWNAYLLESFLRRASAEFRLLSSTSFTKDPTGAVVPRKLDDCSPEDIFAVIARRCGVAAETEEVGNFLVATQCIMRRTPKTVGAVVARMKELEKR